MKKAFEIDKNIFRGTPVFSGTRVPIKTLFDYLEEDESIGSFLHDFPTVNKTQVERVLQISKKIIENLTAVANENFA